MTRRPRLRALAALALTLSLGLGLAPRGAEATELDIEAREGLVVDMTTGAVLLSKDPDTLTAPASMLKLMTLTMVFEALEEGRLSLDDTFLVSEKAWRMGGSKMFVKVGERVSVEDLIRGVIVLSGNDACVVLAEGLAGSEDAFARRMTERAKELGMTSTFGNATGWPHPDNLMTPRDLVYLAQRMIAEHPEFYRYFAETDFEWNGVAQRNRNPLLYADLGADGLKTGHTEEAGYGLVGSAVQDDRRVVFMIGGLGSTQARAQESERIVNWAFREFRNITLYRAGQDLGAAEVWLGAKPSVRMTVEKDALATIPFAAAEDLHATLRYEGPIEAPVTRGQKVAELVVEAAEIPEIRIPVIAAEDVPRGGYLTRLQAAAGLLARRAMGAVLGEGDEAEAPADAANAGG
ncbi:D-alanyl-D-alanine carboxypeptidase [Albimonas sp. CAU 1670]|uniref:D-alanyl-D-alanine carboxypeptidase family protein n=1 Tax=Albimonas sp. CAU 1670 TaxID=3032599 RepID=UPI0023DCCD9F|nr:D-alanyl-D-alanine carboxypeptidase family protein [Albimonas sp. CAU 1670]MDF2233036.1 D-alanyl-D-alanine carboxypeptidase [Albimonas sp. CAU 1670]